MARAKRVSAPLLPKAQIKTGQHKRGIAEPVAQVVKMNTRKKPVRPPRPIHVVLADVYAVIERLPEMA